MKRETLPVSEIQVIDRQRQDLGDIVSLAASLSQYGLIQPLVLNQDKRLIAGGRRLAAAISLNWTTIDVCYRETLSTDELHELELEENVRRKSMAWQEEALTIAKIHGLKSQRNAVEGKAWGQRQTSELFGIQVGTVNYCLKVAKRLKDELILPEDQRRAWKSESISDCWRNVILVEEENRLTAELARRSQEEVNKKKLETQALVDGFVKELDSAPIVLEDNGHITALRNKARENYLSLNESEAKTLYLSNKLNPPEQFELYFNQKRAMLTEHFSVKLTDILIHEDSIIFMNEDQNFGRFDHIITDIPYGIDMSNLEQENTGMDVSSVEKEHDVDDNVDLMAAFFPAAFRCTKDSAFLVTWCDIMQWQYMYRQALAAGWKVQRWPITWCKTHTCMNQAAQYNFTKSTEIAMVCRKPKATLAKPASGCVVMASNEQARKQYGHPFAKPYECWEFLIDHVSIEGQLILEPFAGRGSGVVPLLKKKRNVIGVEINKEHYDSLLNNVQNHFLSMNPNFIFQ